MKIADITDSRIKMLELAEVQTSNLVESLAVNLVNLITNALPNISNTTIKQLELNNKNGFVTRIKQSAIILYQEYGNEITNILGVNKSDILRGISCFVIMEQKNISFSKALQLLIPLADDEHFGVREWVWMALRSKFAEDLISNVDLLLPLCSNKSENIRRFVSELTRPRGVWCSHINALKESPHIAISILDQLCSDDSKYVQMSVGNWLNDCSKTHPSWVMSQLDRWQKEGRDVSNCVIKRATRSIMKGKLKKS